MGQQPYPTCPVCKECSESVDEWLPAYERVVPGAGVCGDCAEKIANAFNMRCTGRWLTWPNPPSKTKKKLVIPADLRRAVFERDAYRCVTCQTYLDHRIPVAKNGPTTFENLQTMCRPCNSRKGTA